MKNNGYYTFSLTFCCIEIDLQFAFNDQSVMKYFEGLFVIINERICISLGEWQGEIEVIKKMLLDL